MAAADEGSFTAAAAHMAMTPPAFSQLIKELETSIGVVLFERTTRRLILTDAGQRLLDSVRRPLADLADVNADMRAVAGGERGRVAISILHSLALGLGTTAIARLRQKRPEIIVKITEDQNEVLVERVLNREVDFGLGMVTQCPEELTFEPLFQDELVAVFPSNHPLRREKLVSWAQLAAVPLILLQPKSSVRRLSEAGLYAAGNARHPITEVASMITAASMAAAGLGVTVLPELFLPSLNMKGLAARPIGAPRPVRRIGVLRRSNRPRAPAETLLIEEIARAAGEMKLRKLR